ncbi:MAG TPA: pilus assembly protein TadC, partial [Sulfitobacter sp.]|nr:pilus assembly protein TadC [Sulfitobacter sp.]
MGWIAILGALGLTMVGATLVMILRQPEDPLAKLKRSQTEAADAGKQQRLRQSDRNE